MEITARHPPAPGYRVNKHWNERLLVSQETNGFSIKLWRMVNSTNIQWKLFRTSNENVICLAIWKVFDFNKSIKKIDSISCLFSVQSKKLWLNYDRKSAVLYQQFIQVVYEYKMAQKFSSFFFSIPFACYYVGALYKEHYRILNINFNVN